MYKRFKLALVLLALVAGWGAMVPAAQAQTTSNSLFVRVNIEEVRSLYPFDGNNPADFYPIVSIDGRSHQGAVVWNSNVAGGWSFSNWYPRSPYPRVGYYGGLISINCSFAKLNRTH